MRRIKIYGLCFAAVCATGAFAAGSASAQPEYFTNGAVITKAISFTIRSTESPTFLGGWKWKCTSDTGKGKIKAPNVTEKLKITYVGCKGGLGTEEISCQKSFSKPGVLSTENLRGKLVMASKRSGGSQVIANELESEKSTGIWAKYSCGTFKVEEKGQLLAEPSPIGTEAATGLSTANTKAEIPGCSEQDLLFVNGTGTCVHLFTASGASAKNAQDELRYKTSSRVPGIEIHP